MNKVNPNAWPELMYNAMEFLFWEPQYVEGTRKAAKAAGKSSIVAFQKEVRKIEDPLNRLLNLFLRLAPSPMIRSCLAVFDVDITSEGLEGLQLRNRPDAGFTQPDIEMESERARVFIEVKVSKQRNLKREQVQKYVLLHAHRDMSTGRRKPYLFFLSGRGFAKQWSPAGESSSIAAMGVTPFLNSQVTPDQFTKKLEKYRAQTEMMAAYRNVQEEVTYGTATWQEFGDVLEKEMKKRIDIGGELGEIVENLTGGFLSDLQNRGLWSPSSG